MGFDSQFLLFLVGVQDNPIETAWTTDYGIGCPLLLKKINVSNFLGLGNS